MQLIKDTLQQIAENLGLTDVEFGVEHPKDEIHGDYSSNIAMAIAKKMSKNPREIAETIATQCQSEPRLMEVIAKIEVAGAGFINFYLKENYLKNVVGQVLTLGTKYGNNTNLEGKKIIVEYTDPNPFKEFHIGHLMSNTIGESIARLKAAEGALLKRANYQGDVGLHVAKSIWGMMEKIVEEKCNVEEMKGWELTIRQKWMGQAYAYGATKYEEDEVAKTEMNALNKVIYDGSNPKIMELYQLGREWSLEYFETIYQRLGTKFDEYFFESETGKVGLQVVVEGLDKGVFEVGDEGAIVYRGEKDGLHTRVFRNKLGLPTYEAKDLGLAVAKYARYPYDLSIVVTANEITEYFRVVLAVMGQLYPHLQEKTVHKPHGIMKLTSGKMSSRTGKVVSGEGLLDELKTVVLAKIGERTIANKEVVADMIAVAALKYTVLKQAVGGDIVYEPEKMTNLEGDTGPYIQYAYARIQSILRKSSVGNDQVRKEYKTEPTEFAIIRWLYRYPEVIAAAATQFAPHFVCTYLYELAGRFNSFYAVCRIYDAPDEVRGTRIELARAVAQVLENGLNVLGIGVPQEM
ncbi:MAG: arginine--tRNA ligase [bacterium]